MGYEKVPTTPPTGSDEDSYRTSEETTRAEEEQLLGFDKHSLSLRWQQQKNKLLGSRWMVGVVVLLVLSNIIALPLLYFSHQRIRALTPQAQKSWLPPDVRTKKLFMYDEEFGAVPSDESNAKWYGLMPNGLGFVLVKNDTAIPETPKLNQSLPFQRATTGVVHQLHCLIVVRAAYYGAMSGNIDAIDPAHLPHCFDYLRQSIMCNADLTMEWVAAPPMDKGSTGWGYEHQCRDYFAIRQWALDNKWGTSTGIW